MTIPTYLPYFVAAGTAATLIAILYGLNRALADAHWPAPDRLRTFLVSAAILLGWLAAGNYARGYGRLPCQRERRSDHSVWHSAADFDRRAHDLVVRDDKALACQLAALSRARRDLSDPLRRWQIAGSIRLACRRGGHRHRSLGTNHGVRLCACPRKAGGLVAAWNVFVPLEPAS